MKKFVSLKLIVFSFILVAGSVSYSATPEIKQGDIADSIVAGVNNKASELASSAFGHSNTAEGARSFSFWI